MLVLNACPLGRSDILRNRTFFSGMACCVHHNILALSLTLSALFFPYWFFFCLVCCRLRPLCPIPVVNHVFLISS